MPDALGRISVSTPSPSGLTFPLISDFGYGMTRDWDIITHQFGSGATLQTQRFSTGSGLRRFQFIRSALSISERNTLLDFYSSVSGALHSFTYNAPNINAATTTPYPVIFDFTPLSVDHLAEMCRAGFNFLEIVDPSSAPIYSPSSILTRFPSSTFATALLAEEQTIIPLFKIQVRDPSVPPLYLSDRRVNVGGRQYLPRVLSIGEAGSDVLLSQDISGRADNFQFTLGNADRAMSLFVQDTSLKFADISFSLFHVESLTQLDLWRGTVLSWKVSARSEFPIFCSDILYPLTQNYPRRYSSRQCWKRFNDGVNCKFSTLGASGSTLAALGGSPLSCDFFLNSSNGCLAHGMSPSFGGHPAVPQSVSIKDSGTGSLFKIGRDQVTSTSTVADNYWGLPLPEIWCDDDGDPLKAFITNAIVIATRDESTFQDVLGIVGIGPLGLYEGMSVQTAPDGYKVLVTPLADGFLPQGFKVDSNLNITGYHPELGLRQITGFDPVATPAQDAFSLGQGSPQHWDVPDPTFSNIVTSQPHNILPFAAGTAFVELRYSKAAGGGISPTTAESHSMTVPISKGLTGISSPTSTTTSGLTNPFWIAVNVVLRALGVDKAIPSTHLLYYVPESLFAGDGSGCAEIADLVVPAILGGGTEKQFRFQGAISESKPVRDWLTEILSCCLGFFSFEFGRLRLGIRENAAASSAFTVANMLFQSLELEPREAAFSYLRIDFANQALQYQRDLAEYNDKDYSSYTGRTDSPLNAPMRSVGLSTMSQTLRVAATLVREETGGIYRADQPNPYVEWDNNYTANWKSTILALGVALGSSISITHPDVPTYPGPVGGSPTAHTWKYRVSRWSLHKDWSLSFTGTSVTDSMYDLDVGPKPADVKPAPLPLLFHQVSSVPAWAPDALGADAADALFPSERTFHLSQSYTVLDDASVLAQALVTGKMPVVAPYNAIGAPDLGGCKVVQSTTGGSLPGGTTLRIQLCTANGIGGFSAPSKILIVQIPAGTSTNSIAISNILWPVAASMGFCTAFYSSIDQLICGQQSFALTDTGGGIYTPTSITITTSPARLTYAVPNPATRRVRIKRRNLVHGGPVGATITAISGFDVTANGIADATLADNWVVRVFAVTGRDSAEAPYWHANITAYDPALGKFTLDRDPTTGGLLVGDAFVVCFKGYDNSATPYVIADAGLSNSTNPVPFAGETVNDPNRIGNAVFVLKGKSRGLSAKITANTATSYTLDQQLVIDATSVYVVVSGAWDRATADSAISNNADNSAVTTIPLAIDNLGGVSLLVGGFTVDQNDVESSDEFATLRMLTMFGAPGTSSPLVIGYA